MNEIKNEKLKSTKSKNNVQVGLIVVVIMSASSGLHIAIKNWPMAIVMLVAAAITCFTVMSMVKSYVYDLVGEKLDRLNGILKKHNIDVESND